MLAAAVKTPELELDKDEAKALAENIAAVNAFYGKVIDPKIMAWTGLIMTCGKIYAPRVVAIKMRLSLEKPTQKPMLRPVPTPAPQRSNDPQPLFPANVNPL
jgi:hypothetical protein